MRLLDLSRLLPGPYCSRILSALGFEVIKIEPPGGGDWLRNTPPLHPESQQGALFHYLQQGKKSLTLDLKSPQGREIFIRLVRSADVLLESFRPSVMERLGLGYATLKEHNPRLVYCSLSGYGSTGPYAERAGHDLNYLGLAGVLCAGGRAPSTPYMPPIPMADLSGSLWAVIGILFALLQRELSGVGQKVEGSLLGAALSLLPIPLSQFALPESERQAGQALSGGLVCYHLYETADGKTISLAALEPQFWSAFCQAIERPDLIAAQFTPAIPGNEAYETLRQTFRQHTQAEWRARFQEVDACCEVVLTPEEAMHCTPVEALGMLRDGELLPALKFSKHELLGGASPPILGEYNVELLQELGYSYEEIEAFKKKGVI